MPPSTSYPSTRLASCRGACPTAVSLRAWSRPPYFAAVESLRLTERNVTVDGIAEDGQLRLMIDTGTTLDGALTQIRDRVGAVGGTVAVADGELRLEMPCAS